MSGNFDDLMHKLNSVKNDESVPQWALLLIDCFKGFMSVVNENQGLKTEIQLLRNDIAELQIRNDDYEQRSRNECLVIHGIPEATENDAREDTDTLVCDKVNELLGVELSLNDIKRSHRLGVKKSNNNNQRATRSRSSPAQICRPIIFRLQSYNKRRDIFTSKKHLKSTGITITENLTRTRYDIYRSAIAKFSKENVWTSDGRIIVKVGGQKHSVTTKGELGKLLSSDDSVFFNVMTLDVASMDYLP